MTQDAERFAALDQNRGTLPALAALLHSPAPELRSRIVQVLSAWPPAERASILAPLLEDSPSAEVRLEVLGALDDGCGEEGWVHVASLIADDDSRVSARALEVAGGCAVAPHVRLTLLSRPRWEPARRAGRVRGLGRVGTGEAASLLLAEWKALAPEERIPQALGAAVARALARTGQPDACAALAAASGRGTPWASYVGLQARLCVLRQRLASGEAPGPGLLSPPEHPDRGEWAAELVDAARAEPREDVRRALLDALTGAEGWAGVGRDLRARIAALRLDGGDRAPLSQVLAWCRSPGEPRRTPEAVRALASWRAEPGVAEAVLDLAAERDAGLRAAAFRVLAGWASAPVPDPFAPPAERAPALAAFAALAAA